MSSNCSPSSPFAAADVILDGARARPVCSVLTSFLAAYRCWLAGEMTRVGDESPNW